MSGQARPEDFVARFESLKKQYFFGGSHVQYDDEGVEIPSAIPDRSIIVKMFENMGLDIPMHPQEPPIGLRERTSDMVGEWWKRK